MDSYDFGYTWTWTHGHLVPLALFAVLAAVALWCAWPRWIAIAAVLLSVWALCGFLIVQIVMRANAPAILPTEAFLPGGSGSVLDLGAGSGRSALMVLLARPDARVTAFDLYSGHFGIEDNTPDRIRANARVAGVEDRLEVSAGDMRALPFPDDSFDAAVSVAAIDHLDEEGVRRALSEASRVVRRGGQFLLVVINVDAWVRVAYPPLPHVHGGYFTREQFADRWRASLEQAGFVIEEQGTRPTTMYFLAGARR